MIYRFNEFEIDIQNYQLRGEGGAVEVEPKVFDLLGYLIANRARLVTRDELFQNLWPGQVVSDTSLSNQVKAARKAIGDDGQKQSSIRTIHGRGYQFIANAIELQTDESQAFTRNSNQLSTAPETHFAENNGVSIAYQVFGEGPNDLIIIPGWLSNLDIFWEEPRVAKLFLALAQFARIIIIDRRGTGLSDRVTPPTFEVQIDDVTAVMKAAKSMRASFLGYSEGAYMCALFAALHPNQTISLITIGSSAKWTRSEDYPYGASREEIEIWFSQVEEEWGGPITINQISPSLANDEKYRHWLAKFYRSSASKAGALAVLRMDLEVDLRPVLPTINVPTLVLQAKGDLSNSPERGRDFADRIPDAKFVEMEGDDHAPWGDCADQIIHHTQKFMGCNSGPVVSDRVLTTVMLIYCVGSEELNSNYNDSVTQQLSIYRGHELKTKNDGFGATFDGPGRAVQCAYTIRESALQSGLNLRIGLHTGECEIRGKSLEGVAIETADSVSRLALSGDILVSRTVKDLVTGAGIVFEDFGTHSLEGISEAHQLFKILSV